MLMKSLRTSWVLALLAVTVLTCLWAWMVTSCKGTVEITFKSGEKATIQLRLNRTMQSSLREDVRARVGGCIAPQTASMTVHSPKIGSLAVELRASSDAAASIAKLRVLNSHGDLLWEGLPDANEPLTWATPLQLAPSWAWHTPVWLNAVMGSLACLCFLMLLLRMKRCWGNQESGPVAFSLVILVAFAAGTGGYQLCVLAQCGAPLPSESWVNDIAVEKALIAQQTAGERVFLVGGSSGLYGVDCERLTHATSRPFVNLATHGGLPLRYHLDECNALLRRGDTVLFHLEFRYWWSSDLTSWEIDQAMTWASRRPTPPSLRIAPWDMVTHVSAQRVLEGLLAVGFREAFPQRLPTLVALPGMQPRRFFGAFRVRLDAHGDLLPRGLPENPVVLEPVAYLDDRVFDPGTPGVRALEQFIADAGRLGVKVRFSFPATIRSDVAVFTNAAQAAWVDAMIAWATAHNATVLGRPEDMQLPMSDFSDTVYHLRPAAREKHTDTLLRLWNQVEATKP